ncbi:D-aminopeptidase [Rhodobacter sphaeroides]|jgi:D-aminopeptidase|uniref:D-aminopeptidase n=1 Tax=Cereibacter sphaeroides (strain ATCC 17023 / DSM 158 / JCM 6121 / CCUG 31486 / LMG 2827 / NBRC 12203 / NCIMB 8253 / ATH 2.4.1.) TaxID=272943 RepID=DAP_CERS4|nr:D-aminopeptidase [Cereibacter sphaeroides]Q3IX78.1 RecName: Full=D-aminopeptidase [Cereibacter sphaeroides 2.4.1]ABA80856.1 D-stereospecific aminopeptidase [Cereibacter sphaeroides 2.4.1]AMJ49181.1 aminopeptidase [Cereibacter sphaeroides]ANS35898.1 aminopeptidase [Cereibacter sphaeroides]ATN64951.1 aminopeptidase [Cereibacter sphaeroides]AXC63147.1 aminopeptidase [Cereibacter sphaeroides 2.4.1]
MTLDLDALDRALDALPNLFRGPGGVAGVVKDGQVVASRAWGYADLTRRRPMETGTRLPICSISKQFTCGALLDTLGDTAAYDARVAEFLPQFEGPLPTLRQLCDNQSGLRDYWALTVLQGAEAAQTFRREDALPLIARMKTGHFPPGTAYSYCNCNFRIVSEILESETGRALRDLYAERIFGPAGMRTAELTSDTRHPADEVVGYEGSDAVGFFPADNGIFWIGDAGISASLQDMLAYESWIDATRNDENSIYRRISVPPAYVCGTPASYGFGLSHETVAGVKVTGHGGALRGFRAQRFHAADERLSVVVIFNHEASAHAAASSLLAAALGHEAPKGARPEGWAGQWLDPESGLLLRVGEDAEGLTLRFATGPDRLTAGEDGVPRGAGVSLAREGAMLVMNRTSDNLTVRAEPLPVVAVADAGEIAGRYHARELEADLVIEARDGGAYAGFEGLLGAGPMERLHPVGPDVWIVTTRRSMDAPAPGDWTLQVRREGGAVTGLRLGCWLARRIDYARV